MRSKALGRNAIDRLYAALEPAAAQHDSEIVLIEVIGGSRSPAVRIYIDTPHGVGFDELSAAQDWIDPIMNELDPFPGAYTLEVSSPGIDRPLRTRAHFEHWIGEEVTIKTDKKECERKIVGVLLGVEGDDVVVDRGDVHTHIPFECIMKANVIGRIDFSTDPDGKEH